MLVSRLDLAAYGPGRPSRTVGRSVGVGREVDQGRLAGEIRSAKHSLPLGLGLGAMLLDDAGYAGPRVLQAVAEDAPAAECLELGASLAGRAPRAGLLIVGDGSARRSPKAPGHLDERAAPFDASVERALRDGDMTALAGLDPHLARELMATGRAAWQVLAGAFGAPPVGEILYSGAPFGVSYLVAVLDAAGHEAL